MFAPVFLKCYRIIVHNYLLTCLLTLQEHLICRSKNTQLRKIASEDSSELVVNQLQLINELTTVKYC